MLNMYTWDIVTSILISTSNEMVDERLSQVVLIGSINLARFNYPISPLNPKIRYETLSITVEISWANNMSSTIHMSKCVWICFKTVREHHQLRTVQ